MLIAKWGSRAGLRFRQYQIELKSSFPFWKSTKWSCRVILHDICCETSRNVARLLPIFYACTCKVQELPTIKCGLYAFSVNDRSKAQLICTYMNTFGTHSTYLSVKCRKSEPEQAELVFFKCWLPSMIYKMLMKLAFFQYSLKGLDIPHALCIFILLGETSLIFLF